MVNNISPIYQFTEYNPIKYFVMKKRLNHWKAEHPKTCRFCEVARDLSILLSTIFMPLGLAMIGHYSYY